MKGFTIIETLVAIVVFTLAFGAVSAFIVLAWKTQGFSQDQAIAVQEARQGIETMIKEIREAKTGEDGSFVIENAQDKEFIFYSDIDNDNKAERIRYFLGTINSGSATKDCVVSAKGGSCQVLFSNFLKGMLKTATIKVSVEGDLGASNEYVEVFADSRKLANLCQQQCSDCPAGWQGTQTFDVKTEAGDNSLLFLADATDRVDPICQWQYPNHAFIAKFEFSWTEELSGLAHELKKGVTKAGGSPPKYDSSQEEIITISSYIRNAPPIFEYFDANNNKISEYPARLTDSQLMKVYLAVNVNPNRPPQDFELESFVQLRNLRNE